ncbi:MAG: PRTRC system protein C [Bacteroides cellulosilyticus]|nr:PRTRC system protein C [Bacteroides cellulosilyticus]
MALTVKGMTRKFKFKHGNETITLDDPDPNMAPEQVMSFYSNTYAELTTATVHGPKVEKDEVLYEFRTTIGVKG